jgi:hypothetical protein
MTTPRGRLRAVKAHCVGRVVDLRRRADMGMTYAARMGLTPFGARSIDETVA